MSMLRELRQYAGVRASGRRSDQRPALQPAPPNRRNRQSPPTSRSDRGPEFRPEPLEVSAALKAVFAGVRRKLHRRKQLGLRLLAGDALQALGRAGAVDGNGSCRCAAAGLLAEANDEMPSERFRDRHSSSCFATAPAERLSVQRSAPTQPDGGRSAAALCHRPAADGPGGNAAVRSLGTLLEPSAIQLMKVWSNKLARGGGGRLLAAGPRTGSVGVVTGISRESLDWATARTNSGVTEKHLWA